MCFLCVQAPTNSAAPPQDCNQQDNAAKQVQTSSTEPQQDAGSKAQLPASKGWRGRYGQTLEQLAAAVRQHTIAAEAVQKVQQQQEQRALQQPLDIFSVDKADRLAVILAKFKQQRQAQEQQQQEQQAAVAVQQSQQLQQLQQLAALSGEEVGQLRELLILAGKMGPHARRQLLHMLGKDPKRVLIFFCCYNANTDFGARLKLSAAAAGMLEGYEPSRSATSSQQQPSQQLQLSHAGWQPPACAAAATTAAATNPGQGATAAGVNNSSSRAAESELPQQVSTQQQQAAQMPKHAEDVQQQGPGLSHAAGEKCGQWVETQGMQQPLPATLSLPAVLLDTSTPAAAADADAAAPSALPAAKQGSTGSTSIADRLGVGVSGPDRGGSSSLDKGDWHQTSADGCSRSPPEEHVRGQAMSRDRHCSSSTANPTATHPQQPQPQIQLLSPMLAGRLQHASDAADLPAERPAPQSHTAARMQAQSSDLPKHSNGHRVHAGAPAGAKGTGFDGWTANSQVSPDRWQGLGTQQQQQQQRGMPAGGRQRNSSGDQGQGRSSGRDFEQHRLDEGHHSQPSSSRHPAGSSDFCSSRRGRSRSRSRSCERDRDRTWGRGAARAAAPSQGRGEAAVQAQGHPGAQARVGVLVGSFKNPLYSRAGPPANAFYWRGRDGLVHDRDGNKWDATTKVLLQAGRGSLDQQAGVLCHTRSAHACSSTPALRAGGISRQLQSRRPLRTACQLLLRCGRCPTDSSILGLCWCRHQAGGGVLKATRPCNYTTHKNTVSASCPWDALSGVKTGQARPHEPCCAPISSRMKHTSVKACKAAQKGAAYCPGQFRRRPDGSLLQMWRQSPSGAAAA